MMKISLVGNCQLHSVGMILNLLKARVPIDVELRWIKPVYMLSNGEYPALCRALEESDRIYCQYHDEKWGIWSTKSLSQLFDVRIVPTLESFVSSPQLGGWEFGRNTAQALPGYNIHFMDFRLLHLYLMGISHDVVGDCYFDVSPKDDAISKAMSATSEKYRRYYEAGMVVFDYSNFYLGSMLDNLDDFHTFNHPRNTQIEWLTNEILADLGGAPTVSLRGAQEMLGQFQVPGLVSDKRDGYKIMDASYSLAAAARLYYGYFNTIDKSALIDELVNSNYVKIMDVVV